MTLNLAPARVEIDAQTHAHVFDALVATDMRWNGWAIPYFTLDEVRRIAAMVESDETRIDIAEDGTVTLFTDYGDGPEAEVIDPVEQADGRYCVGGFSWTWTETDPDAPTDPEALDAWLAARASRSRFYCDVSNEHNHARIAAGEPYDRDYGARRTAHTDAALAVYDLALKFGGGFHPDTDPDAYTALPEGVTPDRIREVLDTADEQDVDVYAAALAAVSR